MTIWIELVPHPNVSQYRLNSMGTPKKFFGYFFYVCFMEKLNERVYKYLKIKILLRDINILKILNIKYHRCFGPWGSQGIRGFGITKPSTIQSRSINIYVYMCVYTYNIYVYVKCIRIRLCVKLTVKRGSFH